MRPLRSVFLLVLPILAVLPPAARGADFRLFKNTWGDVIVATDMTKAGKALTPPTPQQPVYFKGMSLGSILGSIPGDREPDIKQLSLFVAEILAKQGYLGARPGAPEPELFLVLQWGYIKPGSEDLLWFLGYDPSKDIAAPTNPNMLGPEVWRRGMRSNAIDTILQDSQNPIYGIIVTAFEFKSAKSAEPVVYWQTRIGLPANGKSMSAALPVMVAAAGPAIGRPADSPVFLDADRIREGQVKLGELKFLDY
ncbi:MAG: hypothetical protein QG602_915 [Verrucomicrobiota bacterium]|nr:hypothetical protein [Verrucomicrobiota bacterium]